MSPEVESDVQQPNDYALAREAHDRASEGLTLAQMRALSDDEIVRRFDLLAAGPESAREWYMSAQDYLDELIRREAHRQNERLGKMTDQIRRFTVAVFALTGVISLLTAIAVIVALWGD